MPRFEEIAGSLDQIMGVKAVWDRTNEPVMCFGSRGDEKAKDKAHFTQARATAEKAIAQPYLVTIGGGAQVPSKLDGRVIELVRVTGVFGETSAFVRDPALLQRLRQWPVAAVLSEVYAIEGEPHLIDDLMFADKRILANTYDAVRRDQKKLEQLWDALRGWPVRRRRDIKPLPRFRDPGRVQMYGTLYPTVLAGSKEGKRIRKESIALEHDPRLSRGAKEANRERNGGVVVCEACGFADAEPKLFDAHHLEPLATGIRETRIDDFAVLCPTCHRWAHHKSADVLQPLPIDELREARANGG